MKNPESVFGTTLGAKQYTWKEGESRNGQGPPKTIGKRNNSMYSQASSTHHSAFLAASAHQGRNAPSEATSKMYNTASYGFNAGAVGPRSPFGTKNGLPVGGNELNIKVHNLARKDISNTEVLDPVAQLSGRGKAIAQPLDRPSVINNVIRPFATSEVDRERAT